MTALVFLGTGHLTTRLVEGASAVTTAQAGDPLKVLVPRPRGLAAWSFLTTYGGGLLAGDDARLTVAVGPQARLYVGSQASTKISRSDDGRPARMTVEASVADGSLLVWLPDPVVPFAGSRLEQHLSVALATGASLVALDALTAGRLARDEAWDLTSLTTRTVIDRDGQPWLRDALHLRPPHLRQRLARSGALATLFLTGPLVAPLAKALADEVAATHAAPWDGGLLISAAPRPDACLLRLAAPTWPVIERWLHHRLAPLAPLLDGAPWQRRP